MLKWDYRVNLLAVQELPNVTQLSITFSIWVLFYASISFVPLPPDRLSMASYTNAISFAGNSFYNEMDNFM